MQSIIPALTVKEINYLHDLVYTNKVDILSSKTLGVKVSMDEESLVKSLLVKLESLESSKDVYSSGRLQKKSKIQRRKRKPS